MITERVIALLGQGHPAVTVAASLGISESRVSQIASEPAAQARISELRFQSLQKFNALDDKYLSVEETLLQKLESSMMFLQRPLEIARTLQIINAAKRRGQESPEQATIHQNIVNISMPTQVLQKFTVNGQNQVVQIGSQTLLTLPSNKVSELVRGAQENDLRPEKRLTKSPIPISQLTEADL